MALDVRSNDHGDLVVTKGDQYDVREDVVENETTTTETTKRPVRNLGKPVALATRYYHEGADEIAFLNITSFRQGVMDDMPMLHVLEEASKNIFVPLTVRVGGGGWDTVLYRSSFSTNLVGIRSCRPIFPSWCR